MVTGGKLWQPKHQKYVRGVGFSIDQIDQHLLVVNIIKKENFTSWMGVLKEWISVKWKKLLWRRVNKKLRG